MCQRQARDVATCIFQLKLIFIYQKSYQNVKLFFRIFDFMTLIGDFFLYAEL